MAMDPWDSRLARRLVRPLRHTAIHPNHVTTASLVAGVGAAALFARGTPDALAGALFVVSALLDHADGELARMSGKTSEFGQAYDRIADLIVKLSVFTGMGVGASGGSAGWWPALAGAAAGVAVVAIFSMRSAMLRRRGPIALRQPGAGGFEIEDILYGVAPVAWAGLTAPFILAAGVGAPIFALWIARQWWQDSTRAS